VGPDQESTPILPLDGIEVLCRLDQLPFADGSVTAPPAGSRLPGR
jgi:hypothetical protein